MLILAATALAQSGNDIRIEWIGTPERVKSETLVVKWGIKADAQITGMTVSLNGIVQKGINAVVNDGYDMIKSQELMLKKGTNLIEIVVNTVKGSCKSSRTVTCASDDNVVINNDDIVVEDVLALAVIGDSVAQYILGKCYLDGTNGFSRDLFEASLWFKKSAEKSYPVAQYQYAISLLEGRGIYKSVHKGLEWLRSSVAQKYPEAQLKLGICYETGKYVDKDINMAKKLYKECSLVEAKERLNKLGGE